MMKHFQVEQCGAWQIATAYGLTQWVAWAKQGEMVTACPVREPGDVWVEFGQSREEASARVKAEVLS